MAQAQEQNKISPLVQLKKLSVAYQVEKTSEFKDRLLDADPAEQFSILVAAHTTCKYLRASHNPVETHPFWSLLARVELISLASFLMQQWHTTELEKWKRSP